MKPTITAKILAILTSALIFGGCASVKVDDGSYPMGVILPLSGANAEAARDVLNGMELARDEINATGAFQNIPVQLIVRDSNDKDFIFHDAFDGMRRSGVRIINIGFDKEVIARHSTILGADDSFINFLCFYPPVTIDGTNSTRIFLNGAQEGDVIAPIVNREGNDDKRLIVMNVDNLGGKSCGDYLSFNLNLEHTKLYKDVFAEGETRFKVFSQQIMRLNAQYVFYVGYGRELKAFMDSLSEADFNGVVAANCGFYYEPLEAPKGIEFYRVETLFQQGKIKTPISLKFVEAYTKKYGKAPTWMAAYGYDSINMLVKAALEAKLIPAQMQNYFKNTEREGAIGKIKFDSAADSLSEIELVKQN